MTKTNFEGKYTVNPSDPIIITLNEVPVDYKAQSIDVQNRIDSSIDSFLDGDLKLVEIDGALYEEMWDGIYTFRRRAYSQED